MHGDHEPGESAGAAPASWTAPVLWRFCGALRSKAPGGWLTPKPGGESTVHGKPPFALRMHWDHEPRGEAQARQTGSLRYSRVELCATMRRFTEREKGMPSQGSSA